MLKIVIADDHVVLRQGLRSLLDKVDGWQVVGEASDGFSIAPGRAAHTRYRNSRSRDAEPRRYRNHQPAPKARQKADGKFVLSAREDSPAVGEAMRAGAKGCVPKKLNKR